MLAVTAWVGAAVLCAAGAAALLLRRAHTLINVDGESMTPTLLPGDRILVRRVRADRVRTGDLVVAATLVRQVDGRWVPAGADPLPGAHPWMVKRVAATAGEAVPGPVRAAESRRTPSVPPGHVVLLGDNPQVSVDSRQFGCVPAEYLLGRVVSRLPHRASQ